MIKLDNFFMSKVRFELIANEANESLSMEWEWNCFKTKWCKRNCFLPTHFPQSSPPSLHTPLLNPKTSAGREEGGNLSEKVSIVLETKLC